MDSNQKIQFLMAYAAGKPMLSEEEEQRLADRIAQGDENARNELVKRNIPLAVKIAHEFKKYPGGDLTEGGKLELDDLVQVSCYALTVAASRYKSGTGAKFSSYAQYWCHEYCKRFVVRNKSVIHIPGAVASMLARYKAIQFRMKREGKTPNPDDIRKEMPKMTDFMFQSVVAYASNTAVISLYSQIEGRDGDKITLENTLVDETMEESSAREEQRNNLMNAISQLEPAEQDIIKSYFGIDCEQLFLAQVGKKYNRTKEWARLKINKVLGKLQKIMVPMDSIPSSTGESSARMSGCSSGQKRSSAHGSKTDSTQQQKPSKTSQGTPESQSGKKGDSATSCRTMTAIFAVASSFLQATQTPCALHTNAYTPHSTYLTMQECDSHTTARHSPICTAR